MPITIAAGVLLLMAALLAVVFTPGADVRYSLAVVALAWFGGQLIDAGTAAQLMWTGAATVLVGLAGLLQVRLTSLTPGVSGREGCSDAQEVPSRVQA